MAEVNRQIGPLATKIDKVANTVRGLYRNGGDGPPGFLETAREIDNGRFEMIFKILEKLRPIEDFILSYKTAEEQRDRDRLKDAADLAEKVKRSEFRSNRNLVIVGLILSGLTLASGGMRGCGSKAKSFVDPPANPAYTSPQKPQVSGNESRQP